MFGGAEAERASWRSRATVAAVTTALAIGLCAPPSAAGNARPGDLCKGGGYNALIGSNGSTFRNQGQCVSYTARGGTFATFPSGVVVAPAGSFITFSNVTFNACNALRFGYREGAVDTVLVEKPYGCFSTNETRTIGPFEVATPISVFLDDVTCNERHYSSGPHGRTVGDNPYEIDITDSGGFCEVPANQPRPPGGEGNLSLTLTVR